MERQRAGVVLPRLVAFCFERRQSSARAVDARAQRVSVRELRRPIEETARLGGLVAFNVETGSLELLGRRLGAQLFAGAAVGPDPRIVGRA